MSSRPYSPVNSPTGWRRGRFAVARFAAAHQNPPIPPEQWGYMPRRLAADHPHLEVDCRVVPHGVLAIGRCSLCGGRLEHPLAISADGTITKSRTDLRGTFTSWIEAHSSCPETPQEFGLSSKAVTFLERVLSTAQGVFEQIEALPTHLHILFEDDTARALPIYDLPRRQPACDARDQTMAARLGNLGAWMRGRSVEPLIAVVVGEGWGLPADSADMPYPALSANRDEFLLASFTTAAFGRAYVEEIGAGSRRWTVPAPDRWRPMGSRHKLHDGIFAASQVEAPTGVGPGVTDPLPISN